MIDTLALAERLEREYGDNPERARRHARLLGDMVGAGKVATKSGIQELRSEIQHGIGTLRIGMNEVEHRPRAELHKEIGAVRSEMGALAWKMAGLLLAQTAAIVALIKLLPGAAS